MAIRPPTTRLVLALDRELFTPPIRKTSADDRQPPILPPMTLERPPHVASGRSMLFEWIGARLDACGDFWAHSWCCSDRSIALVHAGCGAPRADGLVGWCVFRRPRRRVHAARGGPFCSTSVAARPPLCTRRTVTLFSLLFRHRRWRAAWSRDLDEATLHRIGGCDAGGDRHACADRRSRSRRSWRGRFRSRACGFSIAGRDASLLSAPRWAPMLTGIRCL